MRGAGPVLLITMLWAAPAVAQDAGIRAGVEPAVVTVGERFHLVVESLRDRGSRLELSVALDSASALEATGGQGTDPAAGMTWLELVAWRTGPAKRVPATLVITPAGGPPRTVELSLSTPVVRSVLPADSGRLPPRPPRDVIGADRRPRWVLIGAGVATALLLLVLLYRRRRRPALRPRPDLPPPDARAEALRALDRVRASGVLERGEILRFYEETAEVVRGFAAAWSGDWSRDLTSGELLARLRAAAAPGVSALAEVLDAADRAKFTGRQADAGGALREWEVARGWVSEQGGGR